MLEKLFASDYFRLKAFGLSLIVLLLIVIYGIDIKSSEWGNLSFKIESHSSPYPIWLIVISLVAIVIFLVVVDRVIDVLIETVRKKFNL